MHRSIVVAGIFGTVLTIGTAFGAPVLPRAASDTVSLWSMSGQTYLQTMLAPDSIDQQMDADDSQAVTIISAADIVATIKRFDPSVGQKVFSKFIGGETGFSLAIAPLQGQNIKPTEIRAKLQPLVAAYTKPADQSFALTLAAPMVMLASGSGTLVRLTTTDYYYNYGYEDPNVKTGRSYGVSGTRKLLDATDNQYLDALDAYLQPSNPSPSPFYRTMMRILTNSDPSGTITLGASGRHLLTDLMTVYTAELERHEMKGLSLTSSPWEIDLAEVTLLTTYGAASGKVMKSGQLIDGTARNYYATGPTGSGIGNTRADFTKLAIGITNFELQSTEHPALVNQLIALTPMSAAHASSVHGDVFRRVLLFLNRTEYETTASVNAAAIVTAMVTLLKQVRADQADITAYLS